MTYNNENAMMETKKDFILPAMVEDDCISVVYPRITRGFV